MAVLQLPLPFSGANFAQICGGFLTRYGEGRVNTSATSSKYRIEQNVAQVCRRGFVVVVQSSTSSGVRESLQTREQITRSGSRPVLQSYSELTGLNSANEVDSAVVLEDVQEVYPVGECQQADSKAPLLEALRDCAAQDAASFHFPGHRRGGGAPSQMLETMGISVFAHDLPELPELDNLFAPEGVIAEAQDKAAELFGADATFFLVNGSTCGIQASVMATCKPGDFLILPRNCHLSATSAMVLSGALPKYVVPIYDSQWDIAHGVSAQAIETAITEVRENGGRVGAVLVVSPTYYGVCSSIEKIAKVCHENKVSLIVDEAHGAHFKFHEDLPQSALDQGADIAVQSTHKVLGSLTQSSMLHVRGERVNQEVLSKCLQMVQSTSPSYLLLSSLDAARAQMSEGNQFTGKRSSNSRLEMAINNAKKARARLKAIPSVFVMDRNTVNYSEVLPGLDPLRITIGLWGLSIDGYEVDDILRLEFGVIAELPGIQTITFAVSLGTCERDIDRLVESFRALSSHFSINCIEDRNSYPLHQDKPFNSSELPLPSERGLSPRDAFFSKTVQVDVADSVGKICAELLCPYPPGIPIITPGEVISGDAVYYLRSIVKIGGTISGASDSTLSTVRICQR